MASSANYAAVPRHDRGTLSVANTNRDGTGTIVDVFTAGANGSRVDDVEVVATGTTTAGMVRLFIYNGTNWRLWKELAVAAVTASASVETWNRRLVNLALTLPTGHKLGAAPHNAEGFVVAVTRAGDF